MDWNRKLDILKITMTFKIRRIALRHEAMSIYNETGNILVTSGPSDEDIIYLMLQRGDITVAEALEMTQSL
jgi:hypothetical protein